MSFKYINPGYSKLMQRIGKNNTLTDITDNSKSKTGVAYQNEETQHFNRYEFSSYPENDEFWAKVDFFYTALQSPTYLYFKALSSEDGIVISLSEDDIYGADISYLVDSKWYRELSSSDKAITGLDITNINTAWLHAKFGEAGVGFLEFQINNKKFDRLQDVNFKKPTSFNFFIGGKSTYFSNIIISDEEISPYEEVVRLPVASTTTDMSPRDDGGYIASDTGQTLLQAVDTTALSQEYGFDAKVTGIALVGNPAYEVDEVLGKLTSISKRDNVITEHKTIQLSAI